MGWARLDDSFHDHPKLIGLSLEALGLWTKCFTWAHRHHGSSSVLGFLPTGLPETFAGAKGKKLGNELVTHGLWDVVDNGWAIHDYEDYLPAAERPKTSSEIRNARSEAGKRGADARWGKANNGKADTNLPSSSDGKPMPPTRPDPTRPEEAALPTGDARKKPEVALAADWVPTSAHYERAEANRLDIAKEAQSFRLHAETHDRRAANWNAAFTTWLTKARPAQQGKPNPDAWMNR